MPQINTSRLTAKVHRTNQYLDGTDVLAVHGQCSDPLTIDYKGAPDKLMVGLGIERDRAIIGSMTVACRKCEDCLKQRSNLWAARGHDEMRMAVRTWFGTLTGSPEFHDRCLWLARRRCSLRSTGDYDQLTEPEKFAHRLFFAGKEVTKWLKRVRKQSNASLRYLLTVEAHKSGLPHFHMLLHEVTETPVTKAILEAQWHHGFSHWRLTSSDDPGAAFYVCKYLTKSRDAKVRASKHYGQPRMLASLAAMCKAVRDEGSGNVSRLERERSDRGVIGDPAS